MKLKRKTIEELGQILKDEYNFNLTGKELTKFAFALVGLFGLWEKVEFRHKFGNSSHRAIDNK